jgi:hypothetical protein
MLRAGAGALGLLLLVSLAASGQAARAPTTSFAVQGSVVSISAAGPRVAVHSTSDANGCDYGTIWSATGSVVHLPCVSPNSGHRYADLTLAGTTAVWWDYDTGNHVYCDDVYTTTLARPTAGHGLGICDGTEADTYYEFAGDNTLVAIVDYTVCAADCTGDNGKLLPDGNYGVEVTRVKAGKVVRLLGPVDFRVFLDARNWRVAVIEPKASLTVYDASGKKLWSRPGITGVASGWIDGNSLVLHQTRSVRAYSSAGAGTARPLPRGASVDGVVGGLVVYTVGSSVHLLRLSDGRDRKLVTVKGLVQAEITPAGVFYAAGSTVTFVPIGTALRQLG